LIQVAMEIDRGLLRSMLIRSAERVVAGADELCALDWAIGDGDHGINMRRGFEAVCARVDDISILPIDEALGAVGKTLVSTVGGASGPLYGSFFLAAGAAVGRGRQLPDDLPEVFAAGVAGVAARGRSVAGEKTMLDVLFPVLGTLRTHWTSADLLKRVRTAAREAVERTAPMLATKGRAAYLGSRSVGHVDPGAKSSCLIVEAVCDILERRQ
jgi:phosphoenolpyruvate---glycerone phosphotransferase subunit DhaL